MTRTSEEVVAHHLSALGDGDLEAIMADYGADAVLITPAGAVCGRDNVRAGFARLLTDLPNITWTVKSQTSEGEVVLLEWAAGAGATFADDGVDTFVLRGGLIQAQTASSTWQSRG
jgi:ketosteroid isomerase-like protein